MTDAATERTPRAVEVEDWLRGAMGGEVVAHGLSVRRVEARRTLDGVALAPPIVANLDVHLLGDLLELLLP